MSTPRPVVQTTAAKAWVAALGTLCTVLGAVFADDVLDTSEIASVVTGLTVAVVSVVGVYYTENKPKR